MRTLANSLCALVSSCAIGCGQGGGVTAPPDLPLLSASAQVSAAAGGTVQLGDGTVVRIPAGALAADATVTVSRPSPQVFHQDGWLASVRLEPEGTTFSAPVEVEIPYDATGMQDPDDVVLVHTSTANAQVDVGGETSATELVTDVTRSPGRIVGTIKHFSLLDVVWVPKMFVAPLIPGRYLRSGDILYALTGGDGSYKEAWVLPMHVGMFVQSSTHDGVIESTEPTTNCNPPAIGVVDWQGYSGDCGFPNLNGQHVFAGARRPNKDVTVAQGEAAVKTAHRWLGSPYGVSGLPSKDAGSGVDCVQLAEIGWKGAGVNVTYTPRQLLTPYAQYSNTIPVDTITVKLSEGEVRVPIVVAARMTDILSFSMNSYDAAGAGRVDATVTLTAERPDMISAGRARLDDPAQPPGETGKFGKQAVKDLVLHPNEDDAGLLQHFSLHVEVPSRGYSRDIKNFLNVWVEDDTARPPPGSQDNSCKIGVLCDYCETPQAGSAWLGELEVIWYSATLLNQFSLSASNPTTHERVDFTVTFMGSGEGATPQETTFQVTHDRITGTYKHDPANTAFCCDRFTSSDGKQSDIYGA